MGLVEVDRTFNVRLQRTQVLCQRAKHDVHRILAPENYKLVAKKEFHRFVNYKATLKLKPAPNQPPVHMSFSSIESGLIRF